MPFKDVTTSSPLAQPKLDGAQSREPIAKPPAAPKAVATAPPPPVAVPKSTTAAGAMTLPPGKPKVTLAEAKQLAEDGHDDLRYPMSGKYQLTTDAAATDTSDVAQAKLTKANQTLGRMNHQIAKYEQAENTARAAGDYFLADKLATLRQGLEHERNTLKTTAKGYATVAHQRHAGLPALEGAPPPKPANGSASVTTKPTAAEYDLTRKELGDRTTALHSRYGALSVRIAGLRKLGGEAYAKELASIKVEAKALEAEKKALYADVAKRKNEGKLDAKGAAALDTQLVALVGVTEHAHAKATSQDLDLLH